VSIRVERPLEEPLAGVEAAPGQQVDVLQLVVAFEEAAPVPLLRRQAREDVPPDEARREEGDLPAHEVRPLPLLSQVPLLEDGAPVEGEELVGEVVRPAHEGLGDEAGA